MRLFLAGSFFFVAAVVSRSGTVSWGSEALERLFADSQGQYLEFGSLVLLGTFDGATDFATRGTEFAYLNSQFTVFGSAKIGDGGFYDPSLDPSFWIPGGFGAATDVPVVSTALYYWIFNAASASAATEWGIYSHSAALWSTPANQPDSLQTDIVQSDVANVGSLNAGLAQTARVRATPVPDALPTSVLALVVILMGVVSQRRRSNLI